jgi:hypothetical protein
MILFCTDAFVPKPTRFSFRLFQIVLILALLVILTFSFFFLLFPTDSFRYSYVEDDTGLGLEIPHGIDGGGFENGLLPSDEILRTYTGTDATPSSVSVRIRLSPETESSPSSLAVSVRRSHRAFFLPEGEPITGMPTRRVLAIDGEPYLLMHDTLRPFQNERAALSWTSKDKVLPAKKEALELFSEEDDPVGFRPGTLLSTEDGLFALDGDRLRRIPDSDTFRALGFRSEAVRSVLSEDLKRYEIGPDMEVRDIQPDGTLLHDPETDRYFLVESGLKRPITTDGYREFLLAITTPVEVTSEAFHSKISCEATPSFFRNHHYTCTIPIGALDTLPGASYELSVIPDQDIIIRDISLSFHRRLGRENLDLFFRTAKEAFQNAYHRDR